MFESLVVIKNKVYYLGKSTATFEKENKFCSYKKHNYVLNS